MYTILQVTYPIFSNRHHGDQNYFSPIYTVPAITIRQVLVWQQKNANDIATAISEGLFLADPEVAQTPMPTGNYSEFLHL